METSPLRSRRTESARRRIDMRAARWIQRRLLARRRYIKGNPKRRNAVSQFPPRQFWNLIICGVGKFAVTVKKEDEGYSDSGFYSDSSGGLTFPLHSQPFHSDYPFRWNRVLPCSTSVKLPTLPVTVIPSAPGLQPVPTRQLTVIVTPVIGCPPCGKKVTVITSTPPWVPEFGPPREQKLSKPVAFQVPERSGDPEELKWRTRRSPQLFQYWGRNFQLRSMLRCCWCQGPYRFADRSGRNCRSGCWQLPVTQELGLR